MRVNTWIPNVFSRILEQSFSRGLGMREELLASAVNLWICLILVPGSGCLVCGESLVRLSKSRKWLLKQDNQCHWVPSWRGRWKLLVHDEAICVFQCCLFVAGGWNCISACLNLVGIHRDSQCRWTQQVQTTASFPVPGQFLCSQHSLKLQNYHGQMKGPWLTQWSCCWVLGTTVSCQSGSDFSGECVYVIWKIFYVDHASVPSLLQCSSTCGKGLQSRVVQCMHKVTGRHGNECPVLSKPAAYRQCHQEVCNEKINVNTITSPRLGEWGCWGEDATREGPDKAHGPSVPNVVEVGLQRVAQGQKLGEGPPVRLQT